MIDYSTYEVGRVFDNLPYPGTYYADADKYASDDFRLRNVTHLDSLDSIKDAVDGTTNDMMARHIPVSNGSGFNFLDIGGANGNRLPDIENRIDTAKRIIQFVSL